MTSSKKRDHSGRIVVQTKQHDSLFNLFPTRNTSYSCFLVFYVELHRHRHEQVTRTISTVHEACNTLSRSLKQPLFSEWVTYVHITSACFLQAKCSRHPSYSVLLRACTLAFILVREYGPCVMLCCMYVRITLPCFFAG